MSVPPQGGWQPPPNQGPPPYQGPPQPPPNWRDGPWPPEPPSLPDFAPDKSNTTKYLLIAVAVLVVIGLAVGATLFFTRDSGGGGGSTSSAAPSDVASANDTGPVAIITEEPTCEALYTINNGLAGVEANGWSDQRATLGPVADWTPDQRAHAEAVATAMRNASTQAVALAKQTPHRVMRELYEQFIAYSRAYADSVPSFKPADNYLADAQVSFGNALIGICNAIKNQSASRSIGIEAASSPTRVSEIGDPAHPNPLVDSSNPVCGTWIKNSEKFDAGSSAWQRLDPDIAGSQWTPEQRATQLDALQVLTTFANDMEAAGRQSGNPQFEDLAVLAALYIRAYVAAGDTYTGADSWLSHTGSRINNGILSGCRF